MRHVRTSLRQSCGHAECVKADVDILLSVDVPVLLYYRMLEAATHFLSYL